MGKHHKGSTFFNTGVGARSVTIYRETILNDALLPWALKQFGRNHWTFQQDSASSHKVRETQRFLQEKVPSFISSQQWPPYYPDLNPMDFFIWFKISTKKYHTVNPLEIAHRKILSDHIRAACEAFRGGLAIITYRFCVIIYPVFGNIII